MQDTRGTQIREGKAKILFHTNPPSENFIQFFKDDATAFNALKKGTILRKGELNNQMSSWLFGYLEDRGIPTHFVRKLSEREMLVRQVKIIPVEVVVRNRAAGSILKRLGLSKGDPFSSPLVEYFLKDDGLGDPLIGESHIFHFGWATPAQLELMKTHALQVNAILKPLFHGMGLDLVDFKLEFGVQETSNKLLLADEFTPDGCRLWDLKSGESMDKDRFRHDLGRVEQAYLEVFERLKSALGES